MINFESGAILIISGPSGCGKSTLLKSVYKEIPDYYFSISTTTRAPRVGEKNGVDYFFVSTDEFEAGINNNDFLEYAIVHGNYYGTSKKPIVEALAQNKLVVFDIDVQGQAIVKQSKLSKYVTSVFITTPSLEVLKQRLNDRATDSIDVIEKRVKNSKIEIKSINKYDYIIINDDLEKASLELIAVAKSALLKTKLFDKKQVVSSWLS